jgi:hypothetical protein
MILLCAHINNVQLLEGVDDDITWKLTASGQYSAASAYRMQFLGLIESSTKLFGKLGRLLRSRTMLGPPCKIGFGRRIG